MYSRAIMNLPAARAARRVYPAERKAAQVMMAMSARAMNSGISASPA